MAGIEGIAGIVRISYRVSTPPDWRGVFEVGSWNSAPNAALQS